MLDKAHGQIRTEPEDAIEENANDEHVHLVIRFGLIDQIADPLAGVCLETGSFGEMTRHIRDLARAVGAPLGAVLEGGYEPKALAECVIETLQALGDSQQARSVAPEPLLTSRAMAQIGRYWPL